MKRSFFISLVAIAFIAGGCAKKSVEVEAPQQTVQQPQPVERVTQGTEVSSVGSMEENQGANCEEVVLQKMKEIEKKAKKIYFDFDKYNIRPDQEPRVDYDAKLFNSEEAKDFGIKVEGNTDEWGTDEYNYALGLKRAKSVRDALAERGVDPKRMTIISFGESNPVCTEHTRECWAKNRRVEFEVTP